MHITRTAFQKASIFNIHHISLVTLLGTACHKSNPATGEEKQENTGVTPSDANLHSIYHIHAGCDEVVIHITTPLNKVNTTDLGSCAVSHFYQSSLSQPLPPLCAARICEPQIWIQLFALTVNTVIILFIFDSATSNAGYRTYLQTVT